ncbi:MAG: hypothetical protein EVA77_01850 [Phycisphaeraceae bacterium]|nr:MAG: hypothetical protein EVA77_01850 [Phycisphaeraceae bacterium]
MSESVFNGSRGPWLGGIQPAGSSEPDGGWSWSNGDAFDFTGWLEGEPNNICNGINADRIHFGSPSGGLGGIVGWDDIPGADSCVPPPNSFITEWSADCNNDGIVDYGQILDGTLADEDQNGVPDCCDQGVPCSSPSGEDCNANGVLDSCELEDNDCNANGIPDDCEKFDDCNANGLGDPCDIAAGTSQDINADGVPDECQCIADFVSDGVVDFQEVLAILNDWGPCGPPCPPDINADGVVSFIDLLRVLDAWGPCDL